MNRALWLLATLVFGLWGATSPVPLNGRVFLGAGLAAWCFFTALRHVPED